MEARDLEFVIRFTMLQKSDLLHILRYVLVITLCGKLKKFAFLTHCSAGTKQDVHANKLSNVDDTIFIGFTFVWV